MRTATRQLSSANQGLGFTANQGLGFTCEGGFQIEMRRGVADGTPIRECGVASTTSTSR